ncbi:transcriptional regulator [Streptomyces sp. NBC_01450]|uniref:transcriptional regulator n=1 Tax=Streptomyces sp. NBC_01450 TaxID=2903871 RepID=UPI002E360DC7|nr:transcriptional regulator [Streptomyces sp. NBC_01450]
MVRTARELLEDTTGKLAPDPHANRLLPLIARGAARRSTLAALAHEQRHVIAADRRAFLHLAERPDAGPESAAFFALLAAGEALAQDRLGAYAVACGADEARAAAYEPLADCQAYPAYVAWLALNGSPADVVLALSANFATWGGYCATIAEALRRHYGFDDEAFGFFDFFAAPAPELERTALTAVQAGLDAGRIGETEVLRYGRLLQSYEAKFWHALWELDQRPG